MKWKVINLDIEKLSLDNRSSAILWSNEIPFVVCSFQKNGTFIKIGILHGMGGQRGNPCA